MINAKAGQNLIKCFKRIEEQAKQLPYIVLINIYLRLYGGFILFYQIL
jgi:hypothetical protein